MIEQHKKAAQKRFATGLLLAIAGSIAFSGKAIIVKLAYRYGVDAVTLIMYRMLFALPIFAVMAWWASRGKEALSRHDWLGILGLGFTGYYLASFLDFGVYQRGVGAADFVPQPHFGLDFGLVFIQKAHVGDANRGNGAELCGHFVGIWT